MLESAESQLPQPTKTGSYLERPRQFVEGRDVRRVQIRMSEFLRQYEECFGNISMACSRSGVSRKTYYAWMNSESKLCKRFQRRILKILPGEKVLDAAEGSIMQAILKGDVTASIFTLKTKGRHRGWAERPDMIPAELQKIYGSQIAEIRGLVEKRAQEKGIPFVEELANYLSYFGEKLPEEISEELRKQLV